MSGETLKPCPWCNSKAVLWKADNHEEWFIGCGGECSVNPGRHFDTREDAIAAWNTRHAPTVEGGELVERLRAMASTGGRITCMAEYFGGAVMPSNLIAARLCADAADALASRDAEIERLRGELRRAHLKRLVELSEEFGGYDELSTSALSTLKTAREGNNA